MTLDRCSGRPKVKRLGNQDATTRDTRAVGVPMQGPIGQNQDTLIDPRPGGRRGSRPNRAPNAPNGDRSGIRSPSTPIARAAGGAL